MTSLPRPTESVTVESFVSENEQYCVQSVSCMPTLSLMRMLQSMGACYELVHFASTFVGFVLSVVEVSQLSVSLVGLVACNVGFFPRVIGVFPGIM